MTFALAGNQNCGKTTLFNQLTGSNQRVGNFPGVTVDRKIGTVVGHREVSVVDLPGIYSLSPYSSEEIVTRDFLLRHKPDGIINVVDATGIERSLYLTLQLIELQIPMVLALNMMDEVRSNGGSVDVTKLRETLGIPVVPISALKRQGISELADQAIETASSGLRPQRIDFCKNDEGPSGSVHRAIHAITHLIEDHSLRQGVPMRFAATKLVEGDEPIRRSLRLSENEGEMIEHAVKEMEAELGMDREAALADMRYRFIEDACAGCVTKTSESREYRRSVRIDSVLTHKVWAIPAFAAILLAVFWLAFGAIGIPLSGWLGRGIAALGAAVGDGLSAYGLNPVVRSLIVDGIFAGVGAVIGFVPVIASLFLFISLLEDSGYMARVAYMMDKPLRKIGLSGRSFVPMLMGFGCTVPAILSTRTLSGERDRKMTILITPFMSCGAKIPIYALFAHTFFARYQALVMIGLYLTGILVAIAAGLIMKKAAFRGAPVPFVMELPNYRFPSIVTTLRLSRDKARDFLKRACTVIFVASVAIWVLQTFDSRLNVAADRADSLLALIGKGLGACFAPLGFSDWRVATGLVTGFMAKEAVISTLAVLAGSGEAAVGELLPTLFTPLAACSFLIFTLLYTPCVAAIATAKRELGGIRGAAMIVFGQTAVAWVVAFAVYRIGSLWTG